MRNVRLWRALLGVDKRTVIEDIEFEEFEGQDAEVAALGGGAGTATQRRLTALWPQGSLA